MTFTRSPGGPQTCSVGGDGVQLDRQGEVGVLVVVQGVAVAPGAVEEPLPAEHRSVCEVQPQVLPHLTLLTLPAAGGARRARSRDGGKRPKGWLKRISFLRL